MHRLWGGQPMQIHGFLRCPSSPRCAPPGGAGGARLHRPMNDRCKFVASVDVFQSPSVLHCGRPAGQCAGRRGTAGANPSSTSVSGRPENGLASSAQGPDREDEASGASIRGVRKAFARFQESMRPDVQDKRTDVASCRGDAVTSCLPVARDDTVVEGEHTA